jgi:hypothetical protein
MLSGDPKLPPSARNSVDAVVIKGISNPEDLLRAMEGLLPRNATKPQRPRPKMLPVMSVGQ